MKTLITATVAALLAAAGGAYAGTTHIVGRDGPHVNLAESCTRLVVPKHTLSLEMSVNVIGQQVHCLIRRPDAFARCVRKLGAAPVVAKGHTHPDGTSDWSNVDKVAAYLAAVSDCADSRLSNVVPE